MPDAPATVYDYLALLPDDRREALEAVRETILENLGQGFAEGIQYGMIGYFVPHAIYPSGYHCDPTEPVPFIGLASQKNHMAIYMFCLYTDPDAVEDFTRDWKTTGKRLDMGKSCVRFRKLEDVPLDVVGRAVKNATLTKFIASYESSLTHSARKKPKKKTAKKAARTTATRKTTSKKVGNRAAKKARSGTASKKVAKKATKKRAAKKKAAGATAKKPAKKASKKKTTKRTTKRKPARGTASR